MTQTIEDADNGYVLEVDEDRFVFYVLCGGVGLYQVIFELNSEEQSGYAEEGQEFLRELADSVRRNEPAYRSRAIDDPSM